MLTSKKRAPSGRHKFDVRCKAMSIEHRLCPPRHPQTNGMVKRFNGRISEEVKQTRFTSAAELEATLDRYLKTYNHLIAQRALNHLSPVQALKKWQAEKPDLFVKRVYNQPGLDRSVSDRACRSRSSALSHKGKRISDPTQRRCWRWRHSWRTWRVRHGCSGGRVVATRLCAAPTLRG